MSIPKIIWQTYKSHGVSAVAQSCINTWRRINPDWRHEFLDDDGITEFVRGNCMAEELEVFSGLPLGVMKADFWRYAVLYKRGGVYADIDTSCQIRAELWANGSKGLVTGVEDTNSLFCQWVIAAEPGHPALRRAMDLIVERAGDGIDTGYPDFVHYHTGPGLWTDAILDYLEVKEPSSARNRWGYPDDDARQMSAQRIFLTPELWKERDITIHAPSTFCGGAVTHMFASKRWVMQPAYESWRAARMRHSRECA